MKKTAIFLMIIFIISTLSLLSISKKKLYQLAISEKDYQKKIQYLMQYIKEFGGKEEPNTINVYYFLTLTNFRLKKFNETITYGEQYLKCPNLSDNNKIKVHLCLANAYNLTKSDVNKALHHADALMEIGNKMISQFKDQQAIIDNVNGRYFHPALRLKIKILLKDINDNREIAQNVSELGKKLMDIQKGDIDRFIKVVFLKVGVAFAQHHKEYEKAIDILLLVFDEENHNKNLTKLLQQLFAKVKNNEKVLEFSVKLYEIEREPKLARSLGLLQHKMGNKEEALKYFSEWFLLTGSDEESNAFKYMQQIWFKEIAKDKEPEEKKQGFENIIKEAKARISGNKLEEDTISKTDENTAVKQDKYII